MTRALVLSLVLLDLRRKEVDESPIESPEEALQIADEISKLTRRVRETPGLEEGKVEYIEREVDRILREYSDMNPRRPKRFLRDLSELASYVESTHKEGLLSDKHRRILEITLKKTKMRDFYGARRLLSKFGKPLDVKRERDAKLDRYRSFHRRFESQAKELKAEIDRMKGVPMPEMSQDDVGAVRKAVEDFNEAAAGVLVDYFAHAPCAEAVSTALRASAVPEMDFPTPKNREAVKGLLMVLGEEQVQRAFGSGNLGRLVEVASYSEKRLEHFLKEHKWFQRRLQENLEWLSALTSHRAGALRVDWQGPAESVRAKLTAFESFLKALPRSERAVQSLSNLRELLDEGRYESALRNDEIFHAHGDWARARLSGALDEEIEKKEKELQKASELLRRLPGTEKLLAKASA